MIMNWQELFASRTQSMKASEIRELLKLLDQPDIISFAGGIPDPDLILRTAGEYRLSNFLMWQASYSEFAFVEKYWPDFTPSDLEEVLEDYSMRQRKFGGLATTQSKEKIIREAGS